MGDSATPMLSYIPSYGGGPLDLITKFSTFIIFILIITLFVMLFMNGGIISSYSLAILLILSILTISVFKNIGGLGALKNMNLMLLIWLIPLFMFVLLSNSNFSEQTKNIIYPISKTLLFLIILNFAAPSLISFLGNSIQKSLQFVNLIVPLLLGIIACIAIVAVVMYWDKITTQQKIYIGVATLLLSIFSIYSSDVIAYLMTNKYSFFLNLFILFIFGIINYIVYKFTNNGLPANVLQIVSAIFLLRWFYLYFITYYGKSGDVTFGYMMENLKGTFFCETFRNTISLLIKNFFLLIFLFYIGFIFYIYRKNSFQFLSTYKNLSLLSFLFIGVLLMCGVLYSIKGGDNLSKDGPAFLGLTGKIIGSILGGIALLAALIAVLYRFTTIPSSTTAILYLLNVLLVIVFLSLIISLFRIDVSNVSISSPGTLGFFLNFFMKVLLYLPCLVLNFAEELRKQLNIASKETTSLIILGIELLLISLKFVIPYVFNNVINKSGYKLTKDTIPTDFKTPLIVPPYIKNLKMPKYNYSLSAWIYIHPVPNNKNEAYTENTSLINFGNVPNIMYNAQNQTLVFEIDIPNDMGNKKTIILPESPAKVNITLQKWNHVFINCMEGNFDVFMNGELVSSTPNVVPYKMPLGMSIGSNPGIYGEVSNVVFYREPFLPNAISILYNSTKNMNPPQPLQL